MISGLLRWTSLLLVAAPVLSLAWTYGGSRALALRAVMPWACAACAAGLLLLPQRHEGEDWPTAERRVLAGLLKDPFLWALLVLAVYLAVPLFNVSLCPVCDWRAIDAGADPYPPYRFLPFCACPAEHAGLLWMLGPAFLGALAVRHGLTRRGKRMFLEVVVWNGALLALFGFFLVLAGIDRPLGAGASGARTHFFSMFGYPNMGGAFFTLMYAMSFGLWFFRMGNVESLPMDKASNRAPHSFLRSHYPVIAVALNLGGVLGTYCRAAIILSAALSAAFVIYAVLRAFTGQDWRRARRFRNAVVSCGLMLGLFALVYIYAPVQIGREVGTVDTLSVADRLSGKGQYHTRAATAIMRDFPVFGVGGWGYRHFAPAYLSQKDLSQRQMGGGANIHNDYLQILVEHGVAGFALFALCVWLLARPTFQTWRKRVVKILTVGRSGLGSSSLVLFAAAPPVLWGFLGCIAVCVHAFGDCPLRSGAVLSGLLAVLAASIGFFRHDSAAAGGDEEIF